MDMCIDVCTDMCIDVCIDVCIDMGVDMCIEVCIDMCIDVCIEVCIVKRAYAQSADAVDSRGVALGPMFTRARQCGTMQQCIASPFTTLPTTASLPPRNVPRVAPGLHALAQ